MTSTQSEIRKAAILIDCLDQDETRMLLRQISHQTAREIHQLSQKLDGVSQEEKETVLAEFLQRVQKLSEQNRLPDSGSRKRQPDGSSQTHHPIPITGSSAL